MERNTFKAQERKAFLRLSNVANGAAFRGRQISEDAVILLRAITQGTFDKTEDLPALRESLQSLKDSVERVEASLVAIEELEGSSL